MTSTSSIQMQCHATLTAAPVGREVPLHVVVQVQAPRLRVAISALALARPEAEVPAR